MSRSGAKKGRWLSSIVVATLCFCSWMQLPEGACVPQKGCSTALSYYTVKQGDILNDLVGRFETTLDDMQDYNTIGNLDYLQTGNYLYFPFSCECEDDLLGHRYTYPVRLGDTVSSIANNIFEGLSKAQWINQASGLGPSSLIYEGVNVQVPVNCSCGNPTVSPIYGLFATYPAVSTDNATFLASRFQISESYLRQYNPSKNWSGFLSDGDIVYIPVEEASTGLYPAFNFSNDASSRSNTALVVGASVGGGVALLLVILGLCCCYITFSRKRQTSKRTNDDLEVVPSAPEFSPKRTSESTYCPPELVDFHVDKSVEFSFEELAKATNDFNVANKIGEGGYGAVYLATLRGQRMAVKRMNLQATREFMAELQVLTHVHHTNLVQLIGYCTVDSLFLIYEYVENGTLDRHLQRRHNLPPLSWSARVQIALDTARGLEYIHEHTRPTYIHRDVKSSNILIDMQLHAKVADFGMTKLTESGVGLPTRLVGTFGYMAPEYARYGDVSSRVDVYSFGVVLFEIISAKEAIVRTSGNSTGLAGSHEEQKGLVTLFDKILRSPAGKDELESLVDPALDGNYPLESAWKIVQLAGACTQENPELRPSMRNAVIALMTLSSTTQEWEMSAFGGDSIMSGLISGR